MKVAHRKTQSSIGMEASVGREHNDTWRLVGIFLRKYQFSVIYPPVIWTSWIICGALEDIVPLKYIGLIGGCDYLGIVEGGLVKSFELPLKALCCQRTGHYLRLCWRVAAGSEVRAEA